MSTLINVSGRQRMLSQKIAKDALMIYDNPDAGVMAFYREELGQALNSFDQSHHDLINGNKEKNIRVHKNDQILKALSEIQPFFRKIVESAYEILAITKQKPYDQEAILKHIKTITHNEKIFLQKMDQIVLSYEHDAEANISKIEGLENSAFYIFILLALFITLFIFLPASKTLKHAFVDINEKNENITKMFQVMKGVMFLVNKSGEIINYNTSGLAITSLDKSSLLKAKIDKAIKWRGINIQEIIYRILAGEEFNNLEVKIEDKKNQVLTFLLSVTQGTYEGEEMFLINAYDITSQKKAEQLLQELATKDKLTDLYNRHFLESMIEKELEAATRYDYPRSLAMLDIDDFKKINDQWGHPVGDIVLQEIAQMIRENIRASDYGIRIGGEEFIILMPHTKLEGGYSMAEKLRKTIQNKLNPVVGPYTASFGVAERQAGESYLELYNKADQALYQAKASGKNCVVKFAP